MVLYYVTVSDRLAAIEKMEFQEGNDIKIFTQKLLSLSFSWGFGMRMTIRISVTT
jgi:hypothetical protein